MKIKLSVIILILLVIFLSFTKYLMTNSKDKTVTIKNYENIQKPRIKFSKKTGLILKELSITKGISTAAKEKEVIKVWADGTIVYRENKEQITLFPDGKILILPDEI